MIKNCKKCKSVYESYNEFSSYCSSLCRSRDRFIEIPYKKSVVRLWKDNYIKFPDFYNNLELTKERLKNKCMICEIEYIGFRKCCSNKCSIELKKSTTFKTTGADHNLSNKSKSRKNMEEKLMKEYGIINVFQRDDVKTKLKNTWIEKYGVSNPTMNSEVKKKVRNTNVSRKNWIPIEKRDEFEIYCYHVRYFTTWNINRFGYKYWGSDYHINWNLFGNHLDHIYSKYEGFIEGIPSYIIGSFINLRMIPAKENLTKHTRSDIQKSELYKRYDLFYKENLSIINEIEKNFKEVLKYINDENKKNN